MALKHVLVKEGKCIFDLFILEIKQITISSVPGFCGIYSVDKCRKRKNSGPNSHV